MDALLIPFVECEHQAEADRLLDELVSGRAAPLVRRVVGAKLCRVMGSGARGADPEAEDVAAAVLVDLVERLQALRSKRGDAPIEVFDSYVAVLAFNACHRQLRRRHPARHRLKNQIRYILSRHPDFDLREEGGRDWWSGLSSWPRSEVAAGRSIVPLRTLREDSRATEKAGIAADAARMPLVDLIRAILAWAERPVRLAELVDVIADFRGLEEAREESVELDATAAREHGASPETWVVQQLDDRAFLRRLWREIQELPARQRAALLLNLHDGEGRDVLDLFPLTGTASLRQIAESLELPAEELAGLWNELPLEDARIAVLLGATRQQVINLRKSARARLTRRMARLEPSESDGPAAQAKD
jgi:hypothetical protein